MWGLPRSVGFRVTPSANPTCQGSTALWRVGLAKRNRTTRGRCDGRQALDSGPLEWGGAAADTLAVMRYVSTRGSGPPVAFRTALLAGQAADGGLLMPETLPDVSGELESWRGALLSGPRLRDPAPFHRRHPGGRPSDPRRSDLLRVRGRDRFRGGVRHPGGRPPRAARRSPPPRALPRADPRLQGPRPPAPRASFRLRARALRRDPERPRRNERGHRERRDRGPQGQVERAGVHPVPGGPYEPPPGAPDDDGAGRQRALHRGRGDVSTTASGS